jgi:DHHC palmitoyltransferase
MDEDKNGQNYNIFSSVFFLYFFCYLFWFIFKMKKPVCEKNLKKFESEHFREKGDIYQDRWEKIKKNIKKDDLKKMNFPIVRSLMRMQNIFQLTENYQEDYSFIEIIAFLIDQEEYIKVLELDMERFCPTCLEFKNTKTKHCSICGFCVKYYHHHSFIFERCFNYKNHFYYIMLLIFQEVQLILNLFGSSNMLEKLQNGFFFYFFEIVFLLNKEKGRIICIFFCINSLIFVYNTIFLLFEIYLITKNLTLNEYLNRSRYRYLWKKEKDQNERFYYAFWNNLNQGSKKNINNYFKRFFNSES